ncbi:MAG: thiamine-phosphate kinase [Polyangiaceae bacterium]
MDELARIAMLAKILRSVGKAEGVETGIGDDAAVLAVPAGGAAGEGGAKLVWTIDEQVEGTHFRRELLSWRDVGWRSFMAAVSDVAAMGGEPWCALSALALPADVDDAAVAALVKGQAEAAEEASAPVVGGNLARGTVVSITTTVLGKAARPVLRSGAKAGDGLWLAGSVGLAAAGFRALTQGKGGDARLAAAVASWRLPRALVAQGRAMARTAHAAIDVSDGLARDVGHMAEASGVRIVIDEALLLGDEAIRAAAEALGDEPLGLALHGGEDYALAVTNEGALEGFRCIGEVREGRGLMLRGAMGEREIEPEGFDHFR